MNGYKRIFLKPEEKDVMDGNPKFEYFYLCHSIYTDISHIILKYIIYIENALRTNLSYIIAREYSTEESKYINRKNFITKTPIDTISIQKLIRDLEEYLKNPHKNSFSSYYKYSKNAEIPPWILFMDIEFFKIITLYAYLNNSLRTEIRDFFWRDVEVDPSKANKIFFNSMNFLREYRNIFAHGKRNFKEKINHSVDYELLSAFYDNSYFDMMEFDNYQSKSLYSCILLIMAYLVDENMKVRFYSELFMLIEPYVNQDGQGKKMFGDTSIFDVLNLPEDFFIKMKYNETFR